MIRVLVAEDMRILRDTLVSVLNLEEDIEVVAQVAAGAVSCPPRWRNVPTWPCWISTCRGLTGSPRPRSCMSGCLPAVW